MATITSSNWTYPKPVEVNSNATAPGKAKVQPVILDGSLAEDNTGNKIGYDTAKIDTSTTSTKRESIVITESDGSTTKKYHIENPEDLGTTTDVIVWVYDSNWQTDDSVQLKIFFGGGDGTDYSKAGTGANPWNQGQSAVIVNLFNESSGSLIDHSGNGYDSNSTTGTTFDVDSQFNGGRFFDGSDDQIVVNGNTDFWGMSALTLVGWVNPSTSNSSQTDIINSMAGPNGSNAFFLKWSDHLGFDISTTNTSNRVQSSNLSTGNDYLFYGDYDGSTQRISVDDGSFSTASVSGNIQDASGNDYSYGTNSGLSQYYEGDIDAWRVYTESKGQSWRDAEYEASPKGGPIFFKAQAGGGATTVTATKASFNLTSLVASTKLRLSGLFNVANRAETTLDGSVSSTDESITVTDASVFPSPPFVASIEGSGNREIIEVNEVNGNTLESVYRGQEDTSAQSWSDNVTIANRWTKGTYDKLKNAIP